MRQEDKTQRILSKHIGHREDIENKKLRFYVRK